MPESSWLSSKLITATHEPWSLDAVLARNDGVACLEQFCESEKSEENLTFLLSVRTWQSMWQASIEVQRRASADALIKQHLHLGAPMEVCVPGGHSKYDELKFDMFDKALEHAHKTLSLDTFPRFEECESAKALKTLLLSENGQEDSLERRSKKSAHRKQFASSFQSKKSRTRMFSSENSDSKDNSGVCSPCLIS